MENAQRRRHGRDDDDAVLGRRHRGRRRPRAISDFHRPSVSPLRAHFGRRPLTAAPERPIRVRDGPPRRHELVGLLGVADGRRLHRRRPHIAEARDQRPAGGGQVGGHHGARALADVAVGADPVDRGGGGQPGGVRRRQHADRRRRLARLRRRDLLLGVRAALPRRGLPLARRRRRDHRRDRRRLGRPLRAEEAARARDELHALPVLVPGRLFVRERAGRRRARALVPRDGRRLHGRPADGDGARRVHREPARVRLRLLVRLAADVAHLLLGDGRALRRGVHAAARARPRAPVLVPHPLRPGGRLDRVVRRPRLRLRRLVRDRRGQTVRAARNSSARAIRRRAIRRRNSAPPPPTAPPPPSGTLWSSRSSG